MQTEIRVHLPFFVLFSLFLSLAYIRDIICYHLHKLIYGDELYVAVKLTYKIAEAVY